jgi:hypothetical protein
LNERRETRKILREVDKKFPGGELALSSIVASDSLNESKISKLEEGVLLFFFLKPEFK